MNLNQNVDFFLAGANKKSTGSEISDFAEPVTFEGPLSRRNQKYQRFKIFHLRYNTWAVPPVFPISIGDDDNFPSSTSDRLPPSFENEN